MANSSAVDPPQHPPLITVPFDPHRSTRPRQRHAPIGTATINFGSTSPPPTPPTSTATRTTDGSLSPSASSPDTSMDYDSVQPSQGKTRGRRTSGAGGSHHPSSSSSSALPQRNSYYRDRPSLSPRRQATQDLERLLDSNTSASSNNHVLSGIGQNHYRTQYSASGYGGPGGTTNNPDSTMGGRVSRSVSASASTISSSNSSTSPVFTAVPSTPSAVISPNVSGANSNTFAAPARPSRKTKKYPCDICGAIFTRSGDVRRHKDSKHEPGEGCKCPYCDRVLTRQDALQRHWDKYCRQKSKRHVEKPVSGAPSSPKSPANPTASSSRPAGEYDRRPKRGRNTSGAAALLSAAAAVAASGAEDSAAEDVRMRDSKGGRDGDVGNGRELREEEDDDENDMAAHSTATVTPATYRHIPASSTSASGMFSIISPGPGVGRGYGGGGRKAAAASSSASSSNRWTSTPPPPPTGSSSSSAMAHNGGTAPGGGSVASAYASSGNNGAGATNPYPGSSGYPQYKYFQPPSSFPSSQPQTQINPRDAHKTAAHYEQPQAPSSSRRTRNSRAGGGGTGAGVGGAGVDVRSTSNSHSAINGTTTTPSVPSSSSTTSTTAAPSTRRAGLRDKTKGRRTTTQRNGASGGVADQEADAGGAGGAGSGRLTLSSLAAAAAISAAVPVPVPSVGPSAMPSPNGSATSQGRGSHSNGNPSDYTSHRPPSPHLASSAFGSTSGNGIGGVASSSSLGRDSRADPAGMGGVEVVHSPGSWAGDEDAEGEEEDAAMVMVQLGANPASTASVNASASAAPGGSGTGATPSTGPTPDHSHGPVAEDLGEDDADGEGDEDEMDVDHNGK